MIERELARLEREGQVVRAHVRQLVSVTGAPLYEIGLVLPDGQTARFVDADPAEALAAARRLLLWRKHAITRG